MDQDTTLAKLVTGRSAYRQGVSAGKFPPFAERAASFVRSDKLAAELAKVPPGDHKRRGAIQQAADFIGATKRAMDMRQMSHLDYIVAYRASAAFQDVGEQSRVSRYRGGHL